MAQDKEFDIFGVSVDDLDTGEQKTGGSDLYKPKPDQGKDGVYSSLIRFLPNPKNPTKPFIRKFVYWLEDRDGNGFYVDSPSTVGDKCPVQDEFFRLRNSESAIEKKQSENLKRREVYYALVQIIEDEQKPDLEGQVKIYKFGYKIKTKIDEELNPKFDEPCMVFDPFNGKNFELIITKKAGFPNYDSSKFQGSQKPMTLDGEKVKDTPESRKAILEYLNGAPDLSNFDYTSWTEEERSKVMDVLSIYKSPGSNIDNISKNTNKNDNSDDSRNTSNKQKVSKNIETQNNDEDDGDDLDDFLDDLDL